jgi:hypothetical protein
MYQQLNTDTDFQKQLKYQQALSKPTIINGEYMNKAPKHVEDLATKIEEMMETAQAVKGEAFADLIRYMLNTKSLIKAMYAAIEVSIQEKENILLKDENFISDALKHITAVNTKLFIEALNLTEEQVSEVMKHVRAVDKQVTETMKEGKE